MYTLTLLSLALATTVAAKDFKPWAHSDSMPYGPYGTGPRPSFTPSTTSSLATPTLTTYTTTTICPITRTKSDHSSVYLTTELTTSTITVTSCAGGCHSHKPSWTPISNNSTSPPPWGRPTDTSAPPHASSTNAETTSALYTTTQIDTVTAFVPCSTSVGESRGTTLYSTWLTPEYKTTTRTETVRGVGPVGPVATGGVGGVGGAGGDWGAAGSSRSGSSGSDSSGSSGSPGSPSNDNDNCTPTTLTISVPAAGVTKTITITATDTAPAITVTAVTGNDSGSSNNINPSWAPSSSLSTPTSTIASGAHSAPTNPGGPIHTVAAPSGSAHWSVTVPAESSASESSSSWMPAGTGTGRVGGRMGYKWY